MPELVYNQVDQPVWLEPMTSESWQRQLQHGCHALRHQRYDGSLLSAQWAGRHQQRRNQPSQSNPQNIRNYNVGAVQLYQIYNEPTWVATFVQKNDFGDSFQAVGIVDARHLSGANVIMASTKSEALAQYAQWLADNNVAGSAPTPTGKS